MRPADPETRSADAAARVAGAGRRQCSGGRDSEKAYCAPQVNQGVLFVQGPDTAGQGICQGFCQVSTSLPLAS